MGITAISGPQIVYGFSQTSTGQVTEYNEERGPSLNDMGQGMLDPRPVYCYQPGQAVGQNVRGFWNGYAAVDTYPGTVSTNCLALSQVPSSVSPAAVTLVTCSSINSVITNNVVVVAPETGVSTTQAIGIDMAGANSSGTIVIPARITEQSSLVGLQTLTYGSAGTIHIWDPRCGSARAVQWNGSSNSTAEFLSVVGRDVYGYKMTENIYCTAGASGPNKGQKAWKYIQSVTLNTTAANITSTALMVGVLDVYGFPVKVDHPAYATIWWGGSTNAQLITQSSVWHTVALTSVTQTATTADVRGTFTSSAASNSSGSAPVRMVMFVTPSAQNLPASFSDTVGLFGVAQFSSV